jgi:hypothetical protein
MLLVHRYVAATCPVIVIDEFAPRRDETIGTELDALPDVELTAETDKHAIVNDDGRTGRPDSIEFEVDIVFERAVCA